jgi:Xaa-Pro aminopeptidase
MSQPARLLYANNSDWRYATGLAPDSRPNLWYKAPSGQTHIFAGNRDFGEWKQSATVSHVHNWNTVVAELEKTNAEKPFLGMVSWLIQHEKPEHIEIPSYTPVAFYQQLQTLGVPLVITKGDTFFTERVLKTEPEIAKLQEAQQLNEQLMQLAVNMLQTAKIGHDKTLMLEGSPLTSERIRLAMETETLKLGGRIGIPTIVACGAQAAYPHERGHGALKADAFILIDTFPIKNDYWGDMSRTFVKGTPSPWHVKVYEAVLGAFNHGLAQIKAGAEGQVINASIDTYYEELDMPSGTDTNGTPYGWKKMHGLGHSVGLDIHDPGALTLNNAPCTLQAGMVTSVEPGLYYPSDVNGGVGGVRIEDVLVVTENGHHNLTTFPKDTWVIE